MSSALVSLPAHREFVLQLPCSHIRSQHAPLRRVGAHAELSRRGLCSLIPAYGSLILAAPALAFVKVPEGYLLHRDILDGYSFYFPDSWSVVTTSGNDVFYKNPRVADENVFVAISSPSSSKFKTVADLGSPEDAAKRLKAQFLIEYMSTRIGVKREVDVISAESRKGMHAPQLRETCVNKQIPSIHICLLCKVQRGCLFGSLACGMQPRAACCNQNGTIGQATPTKTMS